MKLFYQEILGFLLVIVTSIVIIGSSTIHFATIQAYSQSYTRLEGYGISIGKLALAKDNPKHELDAKFLKNLQVVMFCSQIIISCNRSAILTIISL